MSVFKLGSETYRSDVVLGKRYRDNQTGLEGVATSLHFYEHACERVTLEGISRDSGGLMEFTFDAPRLVSVDEPKRALAQLKTGGPERATGARTPAGRA